MPYKKLLLYQVSASGCLTLGRNQTSPSCVPCLSDSTEPPYFILPRFGLASLRVSRQSALSKYKYVKIPQVVGSKPAIARIIRGISTQFAWRLDKDVTPQTKLLGLALFCGPKRACEAGMGYIANASRFSRLHCTYLFRCKHFGA